MKSSGKSPRSSELALVAFVLASLVALAAWWVFANGYVLYYGDAQSHLNLSRSIIDSRTPGYDQIGTVWLPVLHVICLPFVRNTRLWSNGLAGTIPVACCFVVAGLAFYWAARQVFQSRAAAWVVIACLALNPNLLYLASIPMTEVVFLAGLAVMLLALVKYEETSRPAWFLLGIAASWSMSLTRYDGWFLIPFAALWFAWSSADKWTGAPARDVNFPVGVSARTLLGRSRPWLIFLLFAAAASLAPLYWIAHNWWETSNALDFYNGPYSAIAIQGDKPYPGYRNWAVAALYYSTAGQLCAGWTLLVTGVAGFIFALFRGVYRPILFLLLTPVFYIWSIHSSKNPIFLPQLPPHGYYNSRYGIAVVAFAAFAAGALTISLPAKWKRFAVALPAFAVLPWIVRPSPQNWIVWKESQVNSESRRAWTKLAAGFMEQQYVEGQGILTPSASGDVAGIFCRAGIPLRDTINVGNGPIWMANTARPLLIHQAGWIVNQQDDVLDRMRARFPYQQVLAIDVKGAPLLRIRKRLPDAPLH